MHNRTLLYRDYREIYFQYIRLMRYRDYYYNIIPANEKRLKNFKI